MLLFRYCYKNHIKFLGVKPYLRTICSQLSSQPRPQYENKPVNAQKNEHNKTNISIKSPREIKKSKLVNPAEFDLSEWITIYRFPYIVPVRIFCRAKLYTTGISALLFPYSVIGYSLGHLDLPTTLIGSGLVFFSTGALYAFGQVFRRIIGSIYLSKDEQYVRISHLTFFGNRQESYYEIGNVLPLSDSNPKVNDPFLKLSFLDDSDKFEKDSLYLSLRTGGVIDREKFEHVFGSL